MCVERGKLSAASADLVNTTACNETGPSFKKRDNDNVEVDLHVDLV